MVARVVSLRAKLSDDAAVDGDVAGGDKLLRMAARSHTCTRNNFL